MRLLGAPARTDSETPPGPARVAAPAAVPAPQRARKIGPAALLRASPVPPPAALRPAPGAVVGRWPVCVSWAGPGRAGFSPEAGRGRLSPVAEARPGRRPAPRV